LVNQVAFLEGKLKKVEAWAETRQYDQVRRLFEILGMRRKGHGKA